MYFVYGTSFMLNVTAEEPGGGAGVLLRAIEPLEGINLMKRLRKTNKATDLARGPGRLAAALEIDRRLDGVDLCASGPLWLGAAVRETADIRTTVRIGIAREVGRLLRFFESDSPFVSGPTTRKEAARNISIPIRVRNSSQAAPNHRNRQQTEDQNESQPQP